MKQGRGFTLIELLVVIAIISLLSSVILSSVATARVKARLVKRVADFSAVKTALELYYDVNNSYPNTSDVWHSECNQWGPYAASDVIPGLSPTYISIVPSEPTADKIANISCYIYKSDGPRYTFIDRLINEPGFVPSTQPGLVDPNRVNTWKIYSNGDINY